MAKTINLGKVGLTFEGDYDSSKNYASRTCVFYNHVSWVSKKDVPAGIAPDSNDEYWQKVSERGAQGIQGERGPQGNSAFDGTGIELVNNLTQGGEASALSAEQGKILKEELTELESYIGIFNVNEYNGKKESEIYNSVAEARMAVPEKYRRYGQIITYRLSEGWVVEQFIGIYINPEGTAWIDVDGQRWIRIDNNKQSAVSYLVFDTDAPTTRLKVNRAERRQNKIICYYNDKEFIVERYTYYDLGDGPWAKNNYWERLNIPISSNYTIEPRNNELVNLLEQIYEPTSNIVSPLKHNYNPLYLAISGTFLERDNHVTFVVANDVPIGKVIAFALIYGDLTYESLKELGITEIRMGISESYPYNGAPVSKRTTAGSPGLRERIVNEDLEHNYVSISFVTDKQGEEAIQIAINALRYLVVEIQDTYKGITSYLPPYQFNIDVEDYGGATKQDIARLQKEIDNIEDVENISDVLNAVKVVPNTIIPLGQNILSDNYTYNNSYWSVENGVIKYNGNGKDSAFVFATPTTNNNRYYARITCYTSDNKYEDLFMTQLGETDIVDVYNGSQNTNGGYISDGGYFKIIATNSKPFEIRSIELLPIVDKDVAIEFVELKTDNVHAGNSEATNINGKWNVAVGPSDTTMTNNINGSRSVAIGLNALRNWRGGLQNIAIGTFAANLLEYGDRNIAIGADALWQVKRAFDNIVIGKGALGNTGQYAEVNRNIAIGYHAMISNSAKTQDSVAIGYNAGRNASARNTFVGNYSGIPISGVNNVGIGYSSMNAGYTDGDNNTCIGVNSGIDGKGTASAPKTINNSIAIGNGVKASKSNQVCIGNSAIEEVIIGNKKIIFNSDGTCTWEAVS